MQHSVSEIYNTDEIDFLLDDIECIGPMKFEIEDFTIAGSRADIVDIAGSPVDPLDSPNLDLDTTCSSWDSHLNYRERLEHEAQNWGVTLQCDTSKLKTPKGLVRILLVVSIKYSSEIVCVTLILCLFFVQFKFHPHPVRFHRLVAWHSNVQRAQCKSVSFFCRL